MKNILTMSNETFEQMLLLPDADLRDTLQDISSVFFGGAPLHTLTIENSSEVLTPMTVNIL